MVLIFHSFKVFSDLRQTLKDFSEDFRKTSQNTLGKSCNAFYARRSSGSLLKFFRYESDFGNFSEDSWKTLGRLLGKSYNVFYARRLPAKSSGSLLPKVVQRNAVKWSPSLSMWRNFIYLHV
ncbi:hypothetical protein DY000_02033758 [Brassica cretica]|uniref:Uncharacterized protein n=1 Tax=Brassica cretica TaxID=69181 RepID=A0ABQ7DFM4_BRACR|nr:hypothetical protein DY000_02033758 [Brassica cretica]